ncbi:acyltransferase [Acinetobacter baumannii]|nr:acyltransferase [Acinetobacter baumannii]MCD0298811.1 acyltransferase [Acinetobacter baumannii]MCD0309712.1 acyltransferase [Acinetobacter baumannii]MCD0312725.1 acyltransferase [Acinetobacter baumannii]MCD0320347.1 acyltransferase [Acinetobacter baumannii]MCD0338957.1 acyltransferase [Acinetobacter baumannii]
MVSSIKFLLHKEIDIYNIFINITLLFGFISPSSYINIGAWSIGNEVFYYAFTPILIIIYLKNKLLGNIIVIILTLISFYFSFFLLDPTYKLSQQWSLYIHPLNNFFLYSCGLALYYNFHNINMKNIAKLLIISSLIIFFFYPISGDQINITTNITRIVFSLASVMLTLGFYKLEIDLPLWFSKPFAHLGEATYGIYLLHPIVYIFINKIFNFPLICIVTTCFITIILSNFTYKYYEKPFIKIGKKIT